MYSTSQIPDDGRRTHLYTEDPFVISYPGKKPKTQASGQGGLASVATVAILLE